MTSPYDDPLRSALFTDLYELTMAQAYAAEGMRDLAVFELYFRQMPASRNYLVAAGLEEVLEFLESFRFTDSDLEYLRKERLLSEAFLQELRTLRFTGDVWAVPEGTIVFAYEPLVQIIAPIVEAQLVETFVLNQIHFQSLAATKASRVVAAATGRTVVDFGSRRAHGSDAALKVARSSYLAGIDGTSNLLAGKRYGIPVFGTMAHSFIQAHDREEDAFVAFAREFPKATMLVDTYDTLAAVQKLTELIHLEGHSFSFGAIRLDSGDLAELARQSRRLLDQAGLHEIRIFASSELDEYRVQELLAAGAPIDGFGVGTRLAVVADAPALDMAYKLVAYAGQPRLKLSSSKTLYPGRKQVVRHYRDGRMERDIVGLHEETVDGQPLLQPVMLQGQRLSQATPPLDAVRAYSRQQWGQLPARLRQLERQEPGYDTRISPSLQKARERIIRSIPPSSRSKPLGDQESG